MPDAIITSTESTFGTISGTFAADQSTIVGTVAGSVVGNLSGSVGVPGPAGPAGTGVPAGGTAGQFLQKIDGVSYNTDWVTVNLGNYLVKSNNLSDLTNFATARDNLQLGTLNTPTFAGVTVQGSGSNVANLGATFLTLNHTGYGQFTIQPSSGITFPDTTVQTTAFNASVLLPYAPLASPLFTGDPRGPTAALGDNDTSLATTAFVQQELLSGTANAKNLEVYVRNQTGSTIAAGSIVYINGATGNRPTVTLAQANNDANSAQTMGFVKTAIANNGFGYVIVRGEVENLDTQALTEGVQLYLSPTTPGAWTTTKPSAPQHLVYVGIVIRSHPTQGVILVAVQNGYEVEELHNSSITSVANNDLFVYESSTSLWKNKSFGTLGLATQSWVTGQGYITSAALSPYLTSATAASTYYPLTNPSGYITSSALTGYATESWVTSQGYLVDAPSDGNQYLRQNGAWTTVSVPPDFITSVTSPLSVTSGDLSIDLSAYETTANAAATYQTISGMSSYLTTSAAASTYFTIASAASKANLASPAFTGTPTAPTATAGTSTTQLATTAFVTTADNLKANVASPTFTGTPAAPTAAADTNTTQLATTAYVVGQAGSATPLTDGTAAVGTSLRYARQDHVHGTDTTRAPLASPTFTGTPAAPTASPGTNTTQIATTAFVTAAVPAFATETQAIYGTSSTTTISPLLMRYIMSNGGYTAYTSLLGNYSSYVSGSGSIPTVFSNFVQVAITAANGKAAFLPNNNVSYHSFSGRGVGELTINWTKPVWFSFRFNYSNTGQIGDANTINRVTIGKVSSTFGDLGSRGIGVRWTAGTSGAFTVMAHNGTTLSTSASAVTVSNTTYFPTTNAAADFLVYSDGAGNVTLFCNNVQVATTTGGPSSGTSAGVRFTFETDNTTSTSGTVTCDYSGIRTMLTY